MMRVIQILLLAIYSQSISAQSIYDYEGEVAKNIECQSLEISFTNASDNIKLSGTLLYPKGDYEKVVMIVPGSGRDTRNSHYVLAENFLRNNVAVYRFDERGIGSSEGKYNYTATILMNDVIDAFKKLKVTEELLDKEIGILGHSLGGIASIGAYGKGCNFDFMIQMATPVEKDGAFIKYQASKNNDGFYSVKNKTTEEVIQFIDEVSKMIVVTKDYKTIQRKGKKIMKTLGIKKALHIIVNPLQVDLVKQNHEKTYRTSTTPILYIVGSKDKIVSSTNETKAIREFDNPIIEIEIIDNVNHWLSAQLNPIKMEKSLYRMNTKAMDKIMSWTLKN